MYEPDDVLDYVIAVNGTVSDSVVLRFSGLFYQMIWHRRPYQQAFKAALAGLSTVSNEQAEFTLQGRRVQHKNHPCARAR